MYIHTHAHTVIRLTFSYYGLSEWLPIFILQYLIITFILIVFLFIIPEPETAYFRGSHPHWWHLNRIVIVAMDSFCHHQHSHGRLPICRWLTFSSTGVWLLKPWISHPKSGHNFRKQINDIKWPVFKSPSDITFSDKNLVRTMEIASPVQGQSRNKTASARKRNAGRAAGPLPVNVQTEVRRSATWGGPQGALVGLIRGILKLLYSSHLGPGEDGMFLHSEITGAHKDAVMSVVMAADCIYTASRDKTLKRRWLQHAFPRSNWLRVGILAMFCHNLSSDTIQTFGSSPSSRL